MQTIMEVHEETLSIRCKTRSGHNTFNNFYIKCYKLIFIYKKGHTNKVSNT